MREIKFRCWFGGFMYYAIPSIIFSKSGVVIVNLNHHEDDFGGPPDTWTGYDDYELMQYTGRKDKNGKEIYDGDICQIHYYHDPSIPSPIGIVKWVDSMTGFSIVGYKNVEGNALTGCYSLNFKSGGEWGNKLAVEVIGNIHENPELLK